MNESLATKLKNEIVYNHNNGLFTPKDFLELANYETIKRTLIRFADSNFITRVIDGIYTKTKISKLTNEVVPTSTHELALKIADNFSWKIIPTGNYALNLLGLSEQIPTTYEYLSTGPYRNYEYGNDIIKFKNTRSIEISNISYKSSLVITAIRQIGKDNITEEIKDKIRSNMSIKERNIMVKETSKVTTWIYEVIKEICLNE